MKKAAAWGFGLALAAFIVDWAILGIKLANGNYDIKAEAYIGAVCLVVLFFCLLRLKFSGKCPHCGKVSASGDRFCSHCGKKMK